MDECLGVSFSIECLSYLTKSNVKMTGFCPSYLSFFVYRPRIKETKTRTKLTFSLLNTLLKQALS